MTDINLTDTQFRWRWRRNNTPTGITEMMALVAGSHPSGTFTDTLLKFEAQSLEAAPLLPQGVLEPAVGAWYKGTVEECDKHRNDLDNNEALGTFWAKLWEPTPPPTTPPTPPEKIPEIPLAKLTILLFQYNFAVPGILPRNHSGVRIFVGNLWEDWPDKKAEEGATFFGSGFDNWAGHTHFTFTLTQEPWTEI